MIRLLFLSLLGIQGALALSTFAQESRQQSSAKAFVDPNLGGGAIIDISSGIIEPLNVIISGLSSPAVLTNDGFLRFAKAIGFGPLCLGVCIDKPQAANLGDGHGLVNQTLELRQEEGELEIIDRGSSLEDPSGVNYLRLFRQNGPTANTGALFLAVFQEEGASVNNAISPKVYDIARGNFVEGALAVTSFLGVNYQTFAKNITGLILPGTPLSVGVNQGITTDGVVVLLTIMIVP